MVMQEIAKIKINGIQQKGPMATLALDQGTVMAMLPRFCRLLSEAGVNIAFLSATGLGKDTGALCCIDLDDQPAAETALRQDAGVMDGLRHMPVTGLLSFYPHRSGLKPLALALQAFGQQQISVYGLTSSIAALTFVIDYGQIDHAVDALGEFLELPPNASPLQPGIKVRQVLPTV